MAAYAFIEDPAVLIDARIPPADLGPAERAALAAVLVGVLAYSPIAKMTRWEDRRDVIDLMRRAGVHRPDALKWLGGLVGLGVNPATVEGLVTAGWLEPWTIPGFPTLVTLSPLAVERLGVNLLERSEALEGLGYWSVMDPARLPLRLPRHVSAAPGLLDAIQDDREDPVADAIDREAAAKRGNRPAPEPEFLTEPGRTETGQLDVDPVSGLVRQEPVLLFGGKIPRAVPGKRRGKAKAKRARARAKARGKARPEAVPA